MMAFGIVKIFSKDIYKGIGSANRSQNVEKSPMTGKILSLLQIDFYA